MSQGKPLAEFDAEFGNYKLKDGSRYRCIIMSCPACDDHSVLIPFSDSGGRTSEGEAIWKHVSGTTLEDITLSPSYHLLSGCRLHGWVRNGCWHNA